MSDELIRVLALGGRIRAVAATTTATTERLRAIHDPSPTVTAALGRAATGALLLAASLEKVTGREPLLTLEIDGGGPAGRFLATASPGGWVRAMVAEPRATAEPRPDGKLDVAGVVGTRGHLAVTRDPGTREPYRGVVALVSGEIATDVAHYLDESEQTPAAAALGVFVVPEGQVVHAGGYLIQVLPGVNDEEAAALAERVRALGTVTDRLRAGENHRQWLEHLFPDGFEEVGRTQVRFHCGCSADRVERALKLLGAAELSDLVSQSLAEPVVLTCEFCRTNYPISRDRLGELLLEVETAPGRPS